MQTSTTPSNTKIMHSISPFINNLDQIDLTRKIIVIFLSKTISLFDSTKHPFLQKNLPWLKYLKGIIFTKLDLRSSVAIIHNIKG